MVRLTSIIFPFNGKTIFTTCFMFGDGGGGGGGYRVDQLNVTFCAVLHALNKDTMILQSTYNI